MVNHAKTHKLRDCEQTVFSDYGTFTEHLVHEHGAKGPWPTRWALDAWKCTQFLERSSEGEGLVCTSLPLMGKGPGRSAFQGFMYTLVL